MTQRKEHVLESERCFKIRCKAEELRWVMSGELDDCHRLSLEKENKKMLPNGKFKHQID
jgi:hypothetical protein